MKSNKQKKKESKKKSKNEWKKKKKENALIAIRSCEFTSTRDTRRRSQWTTSVLELDGELEIELIAS